MWDNFYWVEATVVIDRFISFEVENYWLLDCLSAINLIKLKLGIRIKDLQKKSKIYFSKMIHSHDQIQISQRYHESTVEVLLERLFSGVAQSKLFTKTASRRISLGKSY